MTKPLSLNVATDFRALVNMDAEAIEAWLDMPESRQVGFTRPGDVESVGRQSARAIIRIQRTDEASLTAEDLAHMRKVIGFIRRHRAQRPHRDISRSRWRFSLMNWGHDPLQDDLPLGV